MGKKWLFLPIGALVILTVGFGLRFSNNELISDIGLWLNLVGAFLAALLAVINLIISTNKKKKDKKNNSDNSETKTTNNDLIDNK